jgi:hypothetical protein
VPDMTAETMRGSFLNFLRCEGTTNDKFECGGGGVEGDQYQINTA